MASSDSHGLVATATPVQDRRPVAPSEIERPAAKSEKRRTLLGQTAGPWERPEPQRTTGPR